MDESARKRLATFTPKVRRPTKADIVHAMRVLQKKYLARGRVQPLSMGDIATDLAAQLGLED